MKKKLARSLMIYILLLSAGFSAGLLMDANFNFHGHRSSFSGESTMAADEFKNEEPATQLTDEELSVRRTPIVVSVEKVSKAVVNISTEKIVQRTVNPFEGLNSNMNDDFFAPYFDRFPTRNFKQQTLGSGVIIDPRGYILTNEHVILRASQITVTLPNEKSFPARVIGADPKFDLAILKIDAGEKLPAAKTGNSDTLMIGETVIAIGNPYGLSHTVTTGVLSAIGRSIKTEDNRVFNDFLQTDASINPGNSGGPLVDLMGEVVGINTMIFSGAEGIGFAIPINRAMRAVSELIRFGEIKKTWTGLRVQDLTPSIARHLGLTDNAQGALVSDVLEDSPSNTAAIHTGDVLVEIQGKPVANVEAFHDMIGGFLVGEKVKITLIREGAKIPVVMIMQALPVEKSEELARSRFGVVVTDITKQLISKYSLRTAKGAVIIAVDGGSPSAEIGIQPGDVIRQVGTKEIVNTEDFKASIVQAAEQENVFIVLQRDIYLYYIKL